MSRNPLKWLDYSVQHLSNHICFTLTCHISFHNQLLDYETLPRNQEITSSFYRIIWLFSTIFMSVILSPSRSQNDEINRSCFGHIFSIRIWRCVRIKTTYCEWPHRSRPTISILKSQVVWFCKKFRLSELGLEIFEHSLYLPLIVKRM